VPHLPTLETDSAPKEVSMSTRTFNDEWASQRRRTSSRHKGIRSLQRVYVGLVQNVLVGGVCLAR